MGSGTKIEWATHTFNPWVGWCGPIAWGARASRTREARMEEKLARLKDDPSGVHRLARAVEKRKRRQIDRRRVAAGGLPMWLVGTSGEHDWLLVAARTWREARRAWARETLHCYDDDSSHDLPEFGQACVDRAWWRWEVTEEPTVREPGVWCTFERLADGREVMRGYSHILSEYDVLCEDCDEYVDPDDVTYEFGASGDEDVPVCRWCAAPKEGA